MTSFSQALSAAQALDRADSLVGRRALFSLPEGCLYLVGHSLGPPPTSALERIAAAQKAWQRELVRSWNSAGWIDLAERTGARIAPLIGVDADEVIIADSVSVNLFKLAAAALPLARRKLIMVEEDEFPTDQYIAEEMARQLGSPFQRLAAGSAFDALKQGGILIRSVVNYRSSEVTDIKAFEEEAEKHGTLIVWDLSHATGVMDLSLRSSGARLAAGCTYKYLNGGPGAPAFVYVEHNLASRLASPLPGWMGHDSPFSFTPDYTPRAGTARFASGTPPILSVAALDGALDAFEGVSPAALCAKARSLGDIVIAEADAAGLEVMSPRAQDQRGGHVSIRIKEGYPVVQALAANGIMADFRAPDTVRLGLSPLFLSHEDVARAMAQLHDILQSGSWDRPEFHARSKVT
jgi:kynureninase